MSWWKSPDVFHTYHTLFFFVLYSEHDEPVSQWTCFSVCRREGEDDVSAHLHLKPASCIAYYEIVMHVLWHSPDHCSTLFYYPGLGGRCSGCMHKAWVVFRFLAATSAVATIELGRWESPVQYTVACNLNTCTYMLKSRITYHTDHHACRVLISYLRFFLVQCGFLYIRICIVAYTNVHIVLLHITAYCTYQCLCC